MNENIFTIAGPPGCGKTTALAKWLRDQVSIYGGSKVIACSLTRAAAAEIAGRNSGVVKENVGTLHSICFRALGFPDLTEGKEDEFNKDFPAYILGAKKTAAIDQPFDDRITENTAELGDKLRQEYDLYRVKMIPRTLWKESVLNFADAWEIWKERNKILDFTDLLEICYRDVTEAPGSPAVMVLDEAQDSPLLQVQLCLKWGRAMQKFVLAHDSDQAIYKFAGADPVVLMDLDVPAANRHSLRQSYRLSRLVHEEAVRWIRRCSRRSDVEYYPRKNQDGTVPEGEVHRVDHRLKDGDKVVEIVKTHLAAGQTVMIQATCAYMLVPILASLRSECVPFGNRWRRDRGDWNPLSHGSEKKVMPVDRVLAFLRPGLPDFVDDEDPFNDTRAKIWSWHDVWCWLNDFRSEGVLQSGAKTWLKDCKNNLEPADASDLAELFYPEAREQLYNLRFDTPEEMNKSLDWWRSKLLTKEVGKIELPVNLVKTGGIQAIQERPKVTIGTCHSLKGSEADVNLVFPELSPSGMEEWTGKEEKQDSVRRLMYVAMTRTRDVLYLCNGAGTRCVDWNC